MLVLGALAGALALWTPVHALRAAQFSAGVNLVEVYATVTDAGGGPITDLSASEFTVEEDGRPQRVEVFARGDFPLAVAIGLDRSFSIPASRLTAAVAAARAFLIALRPGDQAMVLGIGSTVETLAPLSTDRAVAFGALERLDRWGTTPLYDAVVAAIDTVQPASGRRALVVLSDGVDRYSKTTAAEMIAAARRRDVLVYPVTTDARPAPVLSELAAVTGGRSYSTSTRRLAATLTTIGAELRDQYLLGYTPVPVAALEGPPRWHAIRVRVSRPGARVRAREGYFFP